MFESLGRFVATKRGGRSKWQPFSLALVLASTSAASCSFPDYGFRSVPLVAGGSSGAPIGAPTAGEAAQQSNGGASAGSGGASAGSAGLAASAGAPLSTGGVEAGAAGAAGEAGGGEAGSDACVPSAPSALPSHCSDGSTDDGETATDCGGSECSPCLSGACNTNSDCVSAECTASVCVLPFQLQTQAIVRNRSTNTLQFRIQLSAKTQVAKISLKSLAIRYYFERNEVAEPIVPTSTQAVLDTSMDVLNQTRFEVVRVLGDPSDGTDAYLEISFTSSLEIKAPESLVLSQAIQSGNAPGLQFDQQSHYSFMDSDAYVTNPHVAVYLNGNLAWGTPPPYSLASGCFYRAVNFNGAALSVADHDFLAGDDASVAAVGTPLSVTTTPFPAASSDYLPLLQTATVLDAATDHVTLQVSAGDYWVYPYVVSAGGANQADLLLQGNTLATFAAGTINGLPTWAKLGPYLATAKDGQLECRSGGGALRLAGVELYRSAH